MVGGEGDKRNWLAISEGRACFGPALVRDKPSRYYPPIPEPLSDKYSYPAGCSFRPGCHALIDEISDRKQSNRDSNHDSLSFRLSPNDEIEIFAVRFLPNFVSKTFSRTISLSARFFRFFRCCSYPYLQKCEHQFNSKFSRSQHMQSKAWQEGINDKGFTDEQGVKTTNMAGSPMSSGAFPP
jgi:hypothetical protein